MSYWIYIVAAVVYSIALGFLTQRLAERKGHEGYFWTGLFFGVIGLIYVVGLPVKWSTQIEYNNDLAKRIAEQINKA